MHIVGFCRLPVQKVLHGFWQIPLIQYWPGLQKYEHVLQRQMIPRILKYYTRIEMNGVLEGLRSDPWKSVWVCMCLRVVGGKYKEFIDFLNSLEWTYSLVNTFISAASATCIR